MLIFLSIHYLKIYFFPIHFYCIFCILNVFSYIFLLIWLFFFREFGEMAVKLLQYSYQDSNLNTIAFLDRRLEDFNNKTIIELAHIAKNKHFIAHSVCQKWLNRRWAGNLLIKKLDWGPIKIPNWVKVMYYFTHLS